MESINYSEFVSTLVKSGKDIQETLTPEKVNILHAAVGVAGEGGELLDAAKRFVVYNKELDISNVIEELGDLEFYMEQMRQAIGVTREQTVSANMVKLLKRYEGAKYTDKAAQERADKQEGK